MRASFCGTRGATSDSGAGGRGEVFGNDDDRRRTVERRRARQQVIEAAAQGVHVGAVVDRLSARLLRRHVKRAADDRALLSDLRITLANRFGNAEVGYLDVAVAVDQEIARLDVAVDDPGGLGVAQPASHLDHQPAGAFGIELFAAVEHAFERAAIDELHREKQGTGFADRGRRVPDVVDVNDVG